MLPDTGLALSEPRLDGLGREGQQDEEMETDANPLGA
eukprot:SAG31_NODE_20218_length_580_cov_14.669439_1_plen_36_part_10